MNHPQPQPDQGKQTPEGASVSRVEALVQAERELEILSGLPGLSDYEQRAEIGDRMARGELVQVNEVWFERVELGPEVAAAGRRAVQAAEEARPHDDELTAHGVGSLSEAIGLAIQDAYAGIEFEDPTFERGTDAVMAVLRERREADRG